MHRILEVKRYIVAIKAVGLAMATDLLGINHIAGKNITVDRKTIQEQ